MESIDVPPPAMDAMAHVVPWFIYLLCLFIENSGSLPHGYSNTYIYTDNELYRAIIYDMYIYIYI